MWERSVIMLKDFKAFVMRGNVIDMAVGIVVGVAFSAIVNSVVADVIMPPIGVVLGQIDFSDLMIVLKEGTVPGPYVSLGAAKAAGAVTVNYGQFINTVINFLIIAAAVFFLIVRPLARLQLRQKAAEAAAAEAEVPTKKECPFCFSTIPVKATRCPQCTTQLD